MALPFDDLQIDVRSRFTAPFQGQHWLGTDALGRDLLARLLSAGRISLTVALGATAISMSLGVSVGLIAGYFGGWVGAALMRLVDALMCIPSIFLLLALASILKPSVGLVIVLISWVTWMEVARVVEGQVRSLRKRDFVLAAQAFGLSRWRILLLELLPNVVGPIVVATTFNVAHAILLESYLSFLGFGVQPPTPTWGNMLDGSQGYLSRAPWLAIAPGMAIVATVLTFNYLGESLKTRFYTSKVTSS